MFATGRCEWSDQVDLRGISGLRFIMDLELKRPIVFFDIESTGLDPESDRIVELAAIKIHPDGTRVPLDKKQYVKIVSELFPE